MYSMLSRHLQRISNVFFMSLFSLFKVLRETSLADSNTTPQGARRGMGGGHACARWYHATQQAHSPREITLQILFGNKQVLTLASNERIPLRAHMRMIFEIRDLKYATPATVSRAGILYISTVEGQQWHSLIASWVTASGYGETVKSQLSDLFDSYIPKVVQLLITQMKTSVECEPTTAVSALLQVSGYSEYLPAYLSLHVIYRCDLFLLAKG